MQLLFRHKLLLTLLELRPILKKGLLNVSFSCQEPPELSVFSCRLPPENVLFQGPPQKQRFELKTFALKEYIYIQSFAPYFQDLKKKKIRSTRS